MNGATTGQDEPGANGGAKVELVASVEADQDGIEAVSPWHIAADDEFLRKLDAQLGPCADPSSLLVGTGEALSSSTSAR